MVTKQILRLVTLGVGQFMANSLAASLLKEGSASLLTIKVIKRKGKLLVILRN